MYGHVLGASTVAGVGALVLPNTGGNPILTVAAIASIVVGSAVALTTIARMVAKRASARA